jgi:Na+-translocating ferredoxin:NAD+ oxidoreductase RNF subunit RnfB
MQDIMIIASITEMLINAWPAALLLLGLGTLFAVILLVASIKLKVEIDPKEEQILMALPRVDCGGCGFAGCASYAKAVMNHPELLGKCTAGGAQTAAAIATILSLKMTGGTYPARPIVHCRAEKDDKLFYSNYDGIASCTSANAQPTVQACAFGCLGFGDCTRACKFDALHVVNGLAVVDYEKCTGCGACAGVCPRFIIRMVAYKHENMMTVACSSRENGKNTRTFCKAGCIGCGVCAKQSDLFAVQDNLARMDYARYEPSEAAETAMTKCPTGVIVYRGKTAPPPRPAGEKAKAAASV